MSQFTENQRQQNFLLTMMYFQGWEGETGLAGGFLALGVIAVGVLLLPLRIAAHLLLGKEAQAEINKLKAELHLYESGQICNSYSHVEITKLRKRLAELGAKGYT